MRAAARLRSAGGAAAATNAELSRQIAEAVKAKQTGVSLATLLSFGKRVRGCEPPGG